MSPTMRSYIWKDPLMGVPVYLNPTIIISESKIQLYSVLTKMVVCSFDVGSHTEDYSFNYFKSFFGPFFYNFK